ncbi:MAG: DNA polymerase III subunit gamma/tau [Nitrospinae bacterium CG11_big_fil_rev_8_21_14_0_20_56_8]|nr:MAG: DNA polymerase III subunit gamma/tau [Nitrospinae bacterium CG11_big_fil_rev_8_21_14_0_20_56_8]
MEFQVSARKWRPQTFNELVGQEHIVRTLKNAIELGRVSHAYLFSGTRGVGKTTLARILAKALNCQNGPTPEPCGTCPFCIEIREGRCIDVQEIDGASNNSVAEVRELIDNIHYATSACRYKVYIIDEIHMLTRNAFNALLKTLEEPPSRVVFIFATTELNKIPETILSRCQSFEFKPLNHRQIIRQLEEICRHEKIQIDDVSLEEIAKNGAGSMRDAQSLMDQVIAYCGKTINSGSVEAVLGIAGQKALENFVDHLIRKDVTALVGQVQEIAVQGKDLHLFCRDLLEYIRHLTMVKVAKDPARLLDSHACNVETLTRQAGAVHLDELHQIFTVLSRTENEMKRSPMAQMVFEMTVLRLTDVRPFQKIDDLLQEIGQQEAGEFRSAGSPPAPAPIPGGKSVSSSGSAAPAPAGAEETLPWDRVRQEIIRKKSYFDHYLTTCRVIEFGPGNLHLAFSDDFTLGLVKEEKNLETIREAVKKICGHNVEVQLSRDTAPPSAGAGADEKKNPETMNNPPPGPLNETEVIQDALDIFGGVVIR